MVQMHNVSQFLIYRGKTVKLLSRLRLDIFIDS